MNPPHATYDLHLHTYWSYDATATVERYFERARDLGMRCLAITEHHNVDSQPEVRAAAAQYPEVRLIPSAELTVNTSFGARDLLCYGLPDEPTPRLRQVYDEYHEWQREAGAALCAGMRALGYDYTDEDRLALLRTYRPERVIAKQGATHVKNQIQRAYVVQRGFAADDAAARQLLAGIPRPPYPAAERVVPAVHEAGGIIALAHPYGYFRGADRPTMDALREECGLDGVECAHASVPAEFTPIYRAYCVEHGLVSVAGSDCHMPEDVETVFARHGGPETWLDELLERLNGLPPAEQQE